MNEIIYFEHQQFTEEYLDNIQNLCRLCLMQNKELDLNADSYLPEKKWIDILLSVTNQTFADNNSKDYPQGICEECSSKLVLFYKFKQKVAASYDILKDIFTKCIAETSDKSPDIIEETYSCDENSSNGMIEELSSPNADIKAEQLDDFTNLLETYDDYDTIKYEESDRNSVYDNEQYLSDENASATEEYYVNVSDGGCYFLDHDNNKYVNESNIYRDRDEFESQCLAKNEQKSSSLNFRESDEPLVSNKKGKIKNIQCDICYAQFTRNSSLKQHATVHSNEKQFKCDLCDKRFTRRAHLDVHMLIHANIRPHTCNECGKAFTKSGDLKRHKIVHSDVCEFMCLICNKEFKRKEYLTTHINAHYEIKPYNCEYCTKSYQSLSGLVKHKKSIHSHKDNLHN